jgi:hypothetical protein
MPQEGPLKLTMNSKLIFTHGIILIYYEQFAFFNVRDIQIRTADTKHMQLGILNKNMNHFD